MRGVVVAVFLVLAGCSRQPARPQLPSSPVTTDGMLARSNLEAMIGGQTQVLAIAPDRSGVRKGLVMLFTTRAATYGRMADYDRAVEVAEEGIRRTPGVAEGWLARASARAALHRFDAALSDLARAEELGADADAVKAARASVALARGDGATARALAQARVERQADLGTLSALGVVLSETGDPAGAEAAFARSLAVYRDTSAFAVAFVEFRQGLLAEGNGDLPRAAERYRAVLRRLPGHSQAALHLASIALATGTVDEARAALTTLVPEATDPEISAVRAAVARKAGDAATAKRESEAARTGYEALLAVHPEAFADHAARFFLDEDPRQALHWAKVNLDNRPTAAAYDLALSAALRAGDVEARCDVGARGAQLPRPTPRMAALVARAREGCPGAATKTASSL